MDSWCIPTAVERGPFFATEQAAATEASSSVLVQLYHVLEWEEGNRGYDFFL